MKELKTFTEVKIRKIDEQLTVELNAVMDHYKQLSASGGLTQYILDFTRQREAFVELHERNKALREKVTMLENMISEKNERLDAIRVSYESFTALVRA